MDKGEVIRNICKGKCIPYKKETKTDIVNTYNKLEKIKHIINAPFGGKHLKYNAIINVINDVPNIDIENIEEDIITNGDVIMSTFKPYTRSIFGDCVYVYFTVEDCIAGFTRAQIYKLDWWNAPYKRGQDNEDNK